MPIEEEVLSAYKQNAAALSSQRYKHSFLLGKSD